MAKRTIVPVKVRDLPAFLAAIEPIARDLESGDLLTALARNADAVIAATAIGAGVERAWLDEQDLDTLLDLATQVLEVNGDFFFQRAIPKLTKAAEKIGKIASGGTNGSPDSSAQASPLTS
ncbi:MAG: hypothetical protein JJ713_05660 [Acidithiobacillus sp.]|uniref:hypothetical protein n=1 Tax=Acidithiobacillus sp. TaxID=1872118 RepID=UPI0025890E2F|nr:hypothetical protein [Acidithiobacillus sp.]MCE5420255.1 hypothetical protein [Acidithiobacillus sp.]